MSTYIPKHRGAMTQTHVQVWEIAASCRVSVRQVIAVLRTNNYDGMLMNTAAKVPLAWAVGVAEQIRPEEVRYDYSHRS